MRKKLVIQELAIVVVGKNHNPTILNPDFLKSNGIVPDEWQLAVAPVCVDPLAQVIFQNGLSIVAQFDKVIFSEPFSLGTVDPVETPRIAREYLETLPHVDYRAIGINPKGHVVFDDEGAAVRFLTANFLAPGPWHEFGNAPVKPAVKLVYTLDKAELNLTVDPAALESEGKRSPVLLFSGNFHRNLSGDTKDERHRRALEVIDNWKADLDTFQSLINERILKQELE
jgi:hypothetical protein